MNVTTDLTADEPTLVRCAHDFFSTHHTQCRQQLPAWRERIGHFLDVPIAVAELDNGFQGSIESYSSADLTFMACRTDAVSQTRSAARISTDAVRRYVFHVAVEGAIETSTGLYPKRIATQSVPGVLALDMGQPMSMTRARCHLLALFVPRALIESVIPEAESIHGRVIEYHSPLARLIPGQLGDLQRNLPRMSASDAYSAMHNCALLIAAAFGQQAQLTGNARAAARAAVIGMLRRYVDANLHDSDLTPERVLRVSQLSRPTLYRMFEHEGGLAAYIRNRRLMQAAVDLRNFPDKHVVEIAYSLGFKSASEFNRAFRRAYDMPPLEFRYFALRTR